jgi:hypothetical protein
MNGAEFFMLHAGKRMLPLEELTGDHIADCNSLLGRSLPLNTGKDLRFSSCWMVVTPSWVATSFKALPQTGFDLSKTWAQARKEALQSGEPCLIIKVGKRSLRAQDLFVTYDPRATRICDASKCETMDITKAKEWTS